MTTSQAHLQCAKQILATLRKAFSEAARALASRCHKGALDAALLDENQITSYELALASADLLAAETFVSNPGNEETLALVFACESVQALLNRLDSLYFELDLDPGVLQSVATGTAWQELRGAGEVQKL